MLNNEEIKKLEELAKKSRQNILKMIYNAQSGHIGGAFSCIDILTVLFHKCMKLAPKCKNDSCWETRDRFVLSKGHASSALYSVMSQCGYFSENELMTFRKLGSRLQGHPCPLCTGVEVATGSLGQGLSMACGKAMALKLDKNSAKVFVLVGDGELQEGSIWESFMHIAHLKLDNIIVIIDRNRLQIDGNTEDIKSLDNLKAKLEAFNMTTYEINGHDINMIYETIENAKCANAPVAIIADTIKGKGVSFMENNAGWHGKAPKAEEFELAMKELI